MPLPTRFGITIPIVSATLLFFCAPLSAQTSEPSAHLHAMPPRGSSTAVAPDLMATMHKMHAQMEAMKLSGDTDRDFMALMRTHHQGAIDMAKIELARGKDDQTKQMAKKMIGEQTREIEELDRQLNRGAGTKK